MTATVRRTLLATCMLAGLAGCSGLLPKPAPPPKLHDFGPAPADTTAAQLPAGYVLGQIEATPGLADRSIRYRLLYDDPTQLHRYAHHRWLAPPARLLFERLQRHLPAAHGGDGRYRIHIQLTTFEQRFTTAHAATAVLDARVEIIDAAHGGVAQAKAFHETVSGAANIGGAITGLAAVGKRATDAIVDWLDTRPMQP